MRSPLFSKGKLYPFQSFLALLSLVISGLGMAGYSQSSNRTVDWTNFHSSWQTNLIQGDRLEVAIYLGSAGDQVGNFIQGNVEILLSAPLPQDIKLGIDLGGSWTNFDSQSSSSGEVSPSRDVIHVGVYRPEHSPTSGSGLFVKVILPAEVLNLVKAIQGGIVIQDLVIAKHRSANPDRMTIVPIDNGIDVRFSKEESGAILIYDFKGEMYFRREIRNERNIQFSTTEFIPGAYFIMLGEGENTLVTKKFVIQK